MLILLALVKLLLQSALHRCQSLQRRRPQIFKLITNRKWSSKMPFRTETEPKCSHAGNGRRPSGAVTGVPWQHSMAKILQSPTMCTRSRVHQPLTTLKQMNPLDRQKVLLRATPSSGNKPVLLRLLAFLDRRELLRPSLTQRIDGRPLVSSPAILSVQTWRHFRHLFATQRPKLMQPVQQKLWRPLRLVSQRHYKVSTLRSVSSSWRPFLRLRLQATPVRC